MSAPARADQLWPAHQPLRVVHCYAGNLYGGIEALLTTLARHGHPRQGLEQHFALCFGGRLAGELMAVGVAVHRLGAARFGRPWSVLAARSRLAAALKRSRADLVITHACWPHAIFAPVARRRGIPVVFWAHDAAAGTHWLERLARRTPPDLCLANSGFTAGTLPLLFPGVPVEVLYAPIAPPPTEDREQVWASVRQELQTSPQDVVIVQASRLERWKGQLPLVAALGRLRDLPNWTAWIAGGPQRPGEAEYWAELRAAAADGGVADRIRFLGQRPDVARLLAAADIHCQPNTGPEPFGVAFVEALASGLPVITSDLGGGAEIVNDDCGRLVPPGDVPALAAALAQLILNRAERIRLGAAGPARATELSDPEACLTRLEALLRSVARPAPEASRAPA